MSKTGTMEPPKRATMPPPARPAPGPVSAPGPATRTKAFAFSEIQEAGASRVVLYGPGGIGKTSLAVRAPGPVVVFDLDDSLAVLRPTLADLQVKVVSGVQTFADLRDALNQQGLWDGVRTIVIDSLTRAERFAEAQVLKTIPHEKGGYCTSIEGFGYGKGYRHLCDTALLLLADLDRHVRAGRNVVLICHDCTANVPNPEGADYIRWEPRLQNQGNGNFRAAVKEWCDHLLCIRYDVSTGNDGKARGTGTRTIYPVEMPVHMAKSRSLKESMPYQDGDASLWQALQAK